QAASVVVGDRAASAARVSVIGQRAARVVGVAARLTRRVTERDDASGPVARGANPPAVCREDAEERAARVPLQSYGATLIVALLRERSPRVVLISVREAGRQALGDLAPRRIILPFEAPGVGKSDRRLVAARVVLEGDRAPALRRERGQLPARVPGRVVAGRGVGAARRRDVSARVERVVGALAAVGDRRNPAAPVVGVRLLRAVARRLAQQAVLRVVSEPYFVAERVG